MPDFGISELLATIGSTLASAGTAVGSAVGSGLGALGVGGTTAGLIGSGVGSGLTGALDLGLAGAGTGGLVGLATGQSPFKTGLQGLEAGAAAGFGGGLGGALGGAAGIGSGVGGALGGAGFGALESDLAGGNPLTGALTGALGGYGATHLPGVGASPLNSAGGLGTATPSGAGSAASTAPSASGGGLPANSLGADLTGATSPVPANIASQPLGNIAGGGIENVTVTAPNLSGLGGNFAAGLGAGSVGANAALGGDGKAAPGSSPLGFVNVTPNQLTGNYTSPNAGLGSQVASALGLGQGTGGFLDKYGGELLQGGLMAYSGEQQQAQLKKLLSPIQDTANQLNQQDAMLEAPLFGGQLPPGAQAAIKQSTTAQKAQIKSTYANLGLSGSTMEADALSQVDQQAAAQTFNMATQLFNQGREGTKMSSDLYGNILTTQLQQDQNLQNAISGFAAQMLGTPAYRAV